MDWPKIDRKFPPLLSEDLVAVQPMTGPVKTGIKFKYVKHDQLTEEMKAAYARHDAASSAVSDFFRAGSGDRWADETYQVDCPNCSGKLTFGGNSYNGHVHACCSTEGCVSWME